MQMAMKQVAQSENPTPNPGKNVILKKWLNIRRKRFWVIVLILLHTLLSFFAAPRLIKHNVIELVKEGLGKNTRILLELAVAAK